MHMHMHVYRFILFACMRMYAHGPWFHLLTLQYQNKKMHVCMPRANVCMNPNNILHFRTQGGFSAGRWHVCMHMQETNVHVIHKRRVFVLVQADMCMYIYKKHAYTHTNVIIHLRGVAILVQIDAAVSAARCENITILGEMLHTPHLHTSLHCHYTCILA